LYGQSPGISLVAKDPKNRKNENLEKPQKEISAVRFPKIIGWLEGKTPAAPVGFQVSVYADGLVASAFPQRYRAAPSSTSTAPGTARGSQATR